MNTTEHHELPSGWKWLKLGRIGEITLGQSPPSSSYRDTPEGLPFFQGKADFGATSPNPTSWCVSPRKIAEEGDILISVRAPVGPTNLADRQCCIGRGLASIRTGDGADTSFVLYALKNFETDLIKQGTGSTFDAITGSQLKNLYIAVPSLSEQVAIARYLDYVDVRVRRLTEAKRKLIGLLTEYKQAIIHRAVTRGLNPNVPLKDSGIEWLGMIPRHWKIVRQKYLCSTKTGTRDTVHQVDQGKYPFFVRSQTAVKIDTYSFDGEAVLTAGDGDIGKIFHYINGKFDFHQRVYKFSDFREVLGKFYFYYARANLHQEVLRLSAKSTVDSIRLPMLQNFPVVIPSVPEQVAIVEYLDRTTAEINIAVARAERQIELLNEYRTRLIADVVTGKLDVRDATLTTEDTEGSSAPPKK